MSGNFLDTIRDKKKQAPAAAAPAPAPEIVEQWDRFGFDKIKEVLERHLRLSNPKLAKATFTAFVYPSGVVMHSRTPVEPPRAPVDHSAAEAARPEIKAAGFGSVRCPGCRRHPVSYEILTHAVVDGEDIINVWFRDSAGHEWGGTRVAPRAIAKEGS